MISVLFETSTKADGNLSLTWGEQNEVETNRRSFLTRFGKTPQDCVVMEVEHGDRILQVDSSHKGQTLTAEAFITADTDVTLFLLTADCFPVGFYDPTKQVIALAHLGWRPVDKQLAVKVVEKMVQEFDSNPSDIQILIGPGIHKESYRFNNPAQNQNPEWADFLTDLENGETQVDLIGYITKQLRETGVAEGNIQVSPVDTAASPQYFSHYRAARTGEPEGRIATIIGLV
ncbi:MAG: polyphenol oxidase family protein [Bacillota bacterium]